MDSRITTYRHGPACGALKKLGWANTTKSMLRRWPLPLDHEGQPTKSEAGVRVSNCRHSHHLHSSSLGLVSDALGIYPLGLTLANLLLFPGFVVALVVGGGNVHTFSLAAVLFSNVAIYAACSTLCSPCEIESSWFRPGIHENRSDVSPMREWCGAS